MSTKVMARGLFITLEGGEGAGKSTQAERLAEGLRRHGRDVVVTREPGGAPLAERIRELLLAPAVAPHSPLADVLLFYAARADHLEHVIRPALAAGRWVISDRFADSTRAYQGAAGGVPASTIDTIDQLVVGATQPDLTLLLDLPAEAGLARAEARRTAGATDRFEAQHLKFHEALRTAFLALAARAPGRFAVIDAARPIDTVAADIWSAVERRLLRPAG